MAIKVGGTDVITNARQLSNIASVDATTVTALGAAGVGGGGGVFDMTANGAISTSDAVAFNSNGTVSKIGSIPGFTDPPSQIATESMTNNATQKFELSYDTVHNKFVLAYDKSGAQVLSGIINTSSFLPVYQGNRQAQTKNVSGGMQILYDSAGSGKHLMVWSYYESDSDDGCSSVVVDASASTPSLGNITSWNDNYRSDSFSTCYDADNANIVISYQSDNGNSYIRAGTVTGSGSGATIAWGTAIQFFSSKVNSVVEYDPDTNQVILMFSTGGATRFIFFTVSGTALTQLTEQSSNKLQHSSSDITTTYTFLRYEPHNNKLLLSYQDNTNGGMFIQAATIGSNSITYGTRVEVSAGGSLDYASESRGSKIALKNNTSGTFYIAYGTNQPRRRIRTATLSGTTITMRSGDYSINKQAHDIIYDPDNNVLIQATKQSSSNTLQVHTNKVVTNSPAAQAFIGFAGENISNGASGEIKLLGNVVTGLSGLTPNTDIYVNDDAALTTNSGGTNYKVGKALTSSALLIIRPD